VTRRHATRRIFGPFNRVEGDLEVQVTVRDGRVTEARVNAPLFRGFETMLQGRDPRDALVYMPRVCGICSVAQSAAAAAALADAMGIEPTPNGRLAADLILACENLADHLTHFYLFFMPDFAREAYRSRPWFDEVRSRFRAGEGQALATVLPARAEWMHLTGILAGKWPHTLSIQPGGSTRPVTAAEKVRLQRIVARFRRFLETVLFTDRLERVAALETATALERWAETHGDSDFARFLRVSADLGLAGFGRAYDRFLSVGAYPQNSSRALFAAGVYVDGQVHPLDPAGITEDVSHAWMAVSQTPRHPFDGVTVPDVERPEAYSWCKAPRWRGMAMETGALARQMVDGHPLIRDLVRRDGGNVHSRVVARLLEFARVLPAMESWLAALNPAEPFCRPAAPLDEGEGVGLVEAARGSLGHWLRVRDGRVSNYQIIAPTTWNFSPRDGRGVPGPLEAALEGLEIGERGEHELRIHHVVRSFDPCMVCTVH